MSLIFFDCESSGDQKPKSESDLAHSSLRSPLLLTLIFKVRTPSGKRLERHWFICLSFFFCQVIDTRVETRSTLIIKHTIVSQETARMTIKRARGDKKKTYIAVVAVEKCRLVRKNKVRKV